jgi:replication factor A1
MAADSSARRQPTFTKVDQLRPGTHGHNLVVKVVDSKMVLQRGGRADGGRQQMRIAECLVGDETGIIVFTARNDQGTWRLPTLLTLFCSTTATTIYSAYL